MRRGLFAALALLCALPGTAAADNTGGVFGPVVEEGHRSWQYRIAVDTDTEALAQRIHYQRSIDDDFMWRVVAQTRRATANADQEFDYVQGELFWQLGDLRPGWQQGLRFDLRLRDGDRPQQVGLNWMHDIELGGDWMLRALALSVLQFGDNDRDALILQTRGSLNRRLAPGTMASLSLFANLGDTDDFGVGKRAQQLGPTFAMNVGRRWQLVVGYLAGLNGASPDHQLRAWLTLQP
ncbi:MAG: hypothetical protein AAF515_22945 [Pseudomonadota bacterium]